MGRGKHNAATQSSVGSTGLLDTLLAKYVVPILGALVIIGLILCVFIPGAFGDVFWFMQ